MAKPKAAKRTIRTARPAVTTDPVHALVEHLLSGFTTTTAARGIRTGSTEAALVKLLGKPEAVHRDQDMGEGRKLTEAWWEREVAISGLASKETLKVTWTTKPIARGVDSAGLTLVGDPSAGRVWRDAFAEVKTRLGTLYKKGDNKSTFRAPGLALDDDEGFVAVFYYAATAGRPPILTINAGVIA
jgi:hypothetical protein